MTIGGSISKFVSSMTQDCESVLLPPEAGLSAIGQQVISVSQVRNTRGYIERVVQQINGCYENGLYDACAVMIRRLIETLIIEVFEYHGIANKIKNGQQDFFYLSDLIQATLTEPTWNLSRGARKALPSLKNVGDKSAHSRRYIAHRNDIDEHKQNLRDTVQELIFLAKLK